VEKKFLSQTIGLVRSSFVLDLVLQNILEFKLRRTALFADLNLRTFLAEAIQQNIALGSVTTNPASTKAQKILFALIVVRRFWIARLKIENIAANNVLTKQKNPSGSLHLQL